MQLSLLPVALPEAGLPRSFRGTRAVMLWDSRGHIAGLVRSHHRTSAVTPWDSDGNAAGLARSRCGTCRVTQQDQRGHSVGLRRSHDGTGMSYCGLVQFPKALAWRYGGHVAVRRMEAPPRLQGYELEVAAGG